MRAQGAIERWGWSPAGDLGQGSSALDGTRSQVELEPIMWSRSPPATNPDLPPTGPAFLTSSLRRASGNNPSSTSQQQSTTASPAQTTSQPAANPDRIFSGSSSKLRSQTANARPAKSISSPAEEEDDAWNDGSDDEAVVKKLTHQASRIGLGLPQATIRGPSSSSPAQPSSPPPQHRPTGSLSQRAPSGGGWSFNPFLIVQGNKSTPTTPSTASAGVQQPPLPVSPPAPTPTSPPPPAAAVSPDVGDEAIADGDADKPQPSPPAERRGSGYQMEQWKAAINPNVDELVTGQSSSLGASPSQADPAAI